MGVYIGQSTRIYDRETGEIHYGRVPAGSVVVPGNLPSADGKYSLYAAIIVKKLMHKHVQNKFERFVTLTNFSLIKHLYDQH